MNFKMYCLIKKNRYETFGFVHFYLNQKDLVGIWQKVKKRERAERKAANTCSHQRSRIKRKDLLPGNSYQCTFT